MVGETEVSDVKSAIRQKLDCSPLGEGAHFYLSLVPTSFIQLWYEQCNVPSAFRDHNLTRYARLELNYQGSGEESRMSRWDGPIRMMFVQGGWQIAKLHIQIQGEDQDRWAHELILRDSKLPNLKNLTSKKQLFSKTESKIPTSQDLEYWKFFINGALPYQRKTYSSLQLSTI